MWPDVLGEESEDPSHPVHSLVVPWRWLTQRLAVIWAWRSNERAIQRLLRELEAAGIFAASPDCLTLCEHIARYRQRSIRVHAAPMPSTISGMVLVRADHDDIYFADQAHPLLGMQAILHELCHLLLGHVTQVTTPAASLSDEAISAALQRSCFDQQREIQAERMAHLLRARWRATQPDVGEILPSNEDPDLEAWRRFAEFVASPAPPQELSK